MKIRKTNLQDVVIVKPLIFNDYRGYFTEIFNKGKFEENIGKFDIIQINKSKSDYGVLRGLHFQKPPFTQAKIVEVLDGIVLDVVLDIRKDSSTFGEHQTFILDSVGMQQLYVPRGFAHGFITLSETAIFQYKVDNKYSAAHEGGIMYNDDALNIDWQLNKPTISEKDMRLESFIEQSYYTKEEFLQ